MKDIELIAYSMVHDYLLGRFPSSKSYDERIIAQKIGYLTQSQGIYLGDNIQFSWHKRGPYSSLLTSMLYKIEKNELFLKEQIDGLNIKNALKPKLDFIKSIIDSRPVSCPEVFWLEINASLVFIKNENPSMDRQTLVGTLLNRKPFLSEYEKVIHTATALIYNAA